MTSPKQSLRTKILRFFEDNPEEELSGPDIAVKFDTPKQILNVTLHRMRARGELERVNVWRKRATRRMT